MNKKSRYIAVLAGAALMLSSCTVYDYPVYTSASVSVGGPHVSASVSWTNASYDANGFPIFGYYYGRPVYGYTPAGAAIFTIAAITAACLVPDWGPATWYCGHWHYPPHVHYVSVPPHCPPGHHPDRRPPHHHHRAPAPHHPHHSAPAPHHKPAVHHSPAPHKPAMNHRPAVNNNRKPAGNIHRPANVQRPATNIHRPANVHRPAANVQRPSVKPVSRPASMQRPAHQANRSAGHRASGGGHGNIGHRGGHRGGHRR